MSETSQQTDDQKNETAAESEAAAKKAKDPRAKDIKKPIEAEPVSDEKKSQQVIETLQAQLEEKDDQLLRAQAEIANIQQRQQKETAALLKYDGQQLAHDVVPELDNLERALATEVDDEAAKKLQHGVQMVYDHLQAALKQNNVTEIEALNQPFDPTKHQAVQTTPAEDGQTPETVVKVLQKGYMLKDRVLRPAMVVVAQ
ncbi:nucleotide exchange factor GrpE [Furfurilactobacillus curtus]|uniref:Protein GrpE n=1 Tax=Furfurilactobacillus curtus TaxID=1746200 RepID=A0ABQ5JLN0_9LACO